MVASFRGRRRAPEGLFQRRRVRILWTVSRVSTLPTLTLTLLAPTFLTLTLLTLLALTLLTLPTALASTFSATHRAHIGAHQNPGRTLSARPDRPCPVGP